MMPPSLMSAQEFYIIVKNKRHAQHCKFTYIVISTGRRQSWLASERLARMSATPLYLKRRSLLIWPAQYCSHISSKMMVKPSSLGWMQSLMRLLGEL